MPRQGPGRDSDKNRDSKPEKKQHPETAAQPTEVVDASTIKNVSAPERTAGSRGNRKPSSASRVTSQRSNLSQRGVVKKKTKSRKSVSVDKPDANSQVNPTS